MDNVIHLHPRAELDGGVITGGGPDAGTPWFFIEYCGLTVWDGLSYEDGVSVLADLCRDGVRTVDLVGRSH
ncbi:hypothetical protein [Ancylobacter vacuolatus]|uniref:Uncharacterized protein n=1 Tax=Ancylobacter vacuolatus TaxID=223389 RepID=A0ABU0DHF2_9HYPH|nr:hypothetical protein [Ancylobacter vacuolatus]MDQ0347852.1 hypothetical protein [Ancylobacter vacuolatus]